MRKIAELVLLKGELPNVILTLDTSPPMRTIASKSPKTIDYWPAVQSMIAADIGSKSELAFRYAIVALGAVFVTWEIQTPVIAVWLTAFLITNGWYSWQLSRVSPPVSKHTYIWLVLLLTASVTLYTSCTIYLFRLDTLATTTIAIAALAAQSLFNLSRHRKSTFTAFYDTAIVAAAALYFGLSNLASENLSFPEQMIIIVCTVGVCIYYVVAQYRNILVNRMLQRSQDEAAQAQKMRAVGQLTAGVAHDFNNLLTVIRGNIELAELAENTLERDARLEESKAAASRAANLTSQLLSFSRKARLETSIVNLDKFWLNSGTFFQSVVPETVRIQKEIDPRLENLFCDKSQLEIAIVNLIVNAVDAMKANGTIILGSRPCHDSELKNLKQSDAASGDYGAIEVRDNGPGIPEHLLSNVTEPFFTTKNVGQGSGLGLSMVKGFAEQSGGELVLKSDDAGTAVILILPTDTASRTERRKRS